MSSAKEAKKEAFIIADTARCKIKNTVGYTESERKKEVLKGADIAISIIEKLMADRFEQLLDKIVYLEVEEREVEQNLRNFKESFNALMNRIE